MSIYSIIQFNSALQQMKQNEMDAQNLAQAKQKTEEQATALDIQKRTAESDIKIKNNAGALNDYQTQNQLDILKKIHGALNDNVEAKQDAQDLAQHQIEQKNQQALGQLKFTAQDPDVQNHMSNLLQATSGSSSPATGAALTAPMGAANPVAAAQPGNANIPSIIPQNTAPQEAKNLGGGLNLSGIMPPATMAGSGQGLDAQTRAGGVQQPAAPGANVAPAPSVPSYVNGSNVPAASPASEPSAAAPQQGSLAQAQQSIKSQFGDLYMLDPTTGSLTIDPLAKSKIEAQQRAQATYDVNQPFKEEVQNTKNLKTAEDYIENNLKSSRSPIGQQDIKVNAAIHARQLIDQAYDPKTGKYDVTQVPYSELTESMGNLLTGTNGSSEGRIEALRQNTLYGQIQKGISFIQSKPTDATSQAVIKQLVGMIDRQGLISEKLRNTAIDNIRTAPIFKHLAPEDRDGLLKQKFGNSFQDELSQAPDLKAQKEQSTNKNVGAHQQSYSSLWNS